MKKYLAVTKGTWGGGGQEAIEYFMALGTSILSLFKATERAIEDRNESELLQVVLTYFLK